MRYQNFVLQIGLDGAATPQARVLASPAGEGSASLRFPRPPEEMLRLGVAFARGQQAWREGRPMREPLVHESVEIGRLLAETIFVDDVARLFERSLGMASKENGDGLRLILRFDLGGHGHWLEALPWELLQRGEVQLALDRRSPVVRYLEVPQPVELSALPPTLRILALTAAPRDLAQLDLEREQRLIAAVAKRSRKVEFRLVEHATAATLRRALVEFAPHVFHFMGHGTFDPATGQGALILEGDDGLAAPLDSHALAAKLRDARISLAVLNACNSASGTLAGDPYGSVARALVSGGLPAVLAMRNPVSDRAAIAFSSGFYATLALGASVDEAMADGRQAIHAGDPESLEWATPALYVRTATGVLFAPPAPRARRWRWVAAAGLVLALLVPLGRGWLGSRVYAVEIDKVVGSSVPGLAARVETVELLEDGTMKVYFEVENDSARPQVVGFDFRQTYLADEHGNAYDVLRSSAPIADSANLIETVPDGAARRYWVQVPAPRDGARSFHFEVAAMAQSEVALKPVQWRLPTYPANLTRESPAQVKVEGAEELGLDADLATDRRDVQARVARVEWKPGELTRWSFEVWNRGAEQLDVDLDFAAIRLVDESGREYRPLRFGPPAGASGDQQEHFKLRRAVRTRYWIEFPQPWAGARTFQVFLGTRDASRLGFAPGRARLHSESLDRLLPAVEEPPPPVVRRPRPPPPAPEPEPEEFMGPQQAGPILPPVPFVPRTSVKVASFAIGDGQIQLRSSLPGLGAKLVGIDRLDNGRVRWNLQVVNRGETPIEYGFRTDITKLMDERGLQFRLQATSVDDYVVDSLFRQMLGTGEGADFWVEFSGQFAGTKNLTLILGSPDPDLYRYLPLRAPID
jgi:hypothetical protein